MKKVHVLVALGGMTLAAAALADTPSPERLGTPTQATIVDAKYECTTKYSPKITGAIKNTGTATASFGGSVTVTHNGDCIKWSTCPPSGPCFKTCEKYGPGSTGNHVIGPFSIAAGATHNFSVTLAQKSILKSDIKVKEEGSTTSVEKSLGSFAEVSCFPPPS